MSKETRRLYVKPRILHREKIEVLAATCDSQWMPNKSCMLQGEPSCLKTRF